jgi:hypothetical protein
MARPYADGQTRDNLLPWCAAMVEAGLKPPDYAEGMDQSL